jgi:hypothetical protein
LVLKVGAVSLRSSGIKLNSKKLNKILDKGGKVSGEIRPPTAGAKKLSSRRASVE